jgi:hypothetical protein
MVCLVVVPHSDARESARVRRPGHRLVNVQAVLARAVSVACDEVGGSACTPQTVARRDLGHGLAHYAITIQVGTGAFDRITLHRVVAEHPGGLPISGRQAVMLLPSHVFPFARFYLPPLCPGEAPYESCAAVTLAGRGIDVWGMDLRMAHVPEDTEHFGFMADWGMEAQMADTRVAMLAARLARTSTVRPPRSGLNLLGFGRNVWLAFALANFETQLPSASRSIAGLIAVDQAFQYGPEGEPTRLVDCTFEAAQRTAISSGTYSESNSHLKQPGAAALSDPDGQSAYLEGFTNREYALLVGAATYLRYAPVPHYHLTAGELDDDGHPIRLLYTAEQRWFETMAAAIPHESRQYFADTMAIACGETDVPFDDHLADITVPVLYIGSAGGYGELGVYSTTQLGSTDVSTLIVQHQTQENAFLDFGHADTWLSATAEAEVWIPLAQWLAAR